jgi:hypothetical protein
MRAGSTSGWMAGAARLTEPAVKTHLPHPYAKPGVKDRAAAVTAALGSGLLTPGQTARWYQPGRHPLRTSIDAR